MSNSDVSMSSTSSEDDDSGYKADFIDVNDLSNQTLEIFKAFLNDQSASECEETLAFYNLAVDTSSAPTSLCCSVSEDIEKIPADTATTSADAAASASAAAAAAAAAGAECVPSTSQGFSTSGPIDGNLDKWIPENWRLSQFWYDDATINSLTNFCGKIKSDANVVIALVSCPSLYQSVRAIRTNPADIVTLFEYDERFAIYGDSFVKYDYNEVQPDGDYLSEHFNSYDIIIADPPYLSDECLHKTSIFMLNIVRKDIEPKVILCSGASVEQFAKKYFRLKKCKFQPSHKRNVGNEFASYANFNLDSFIN